MANISTELTAALRKALQEQDTGNGKVGSMDSDMVSGKVYVSTNGNIVDTSDGSIIVEDATDEQVELIRMRRDRTYIDIRIERHTSNEHGLGDLFVYNERVTVGDYIDAEIALRMALSDTSCRLRGLHGEHDITVHVTSPRRRRILNVEGMFQWSGYDKAHRLVVLHASEYNYNYRYVRTYTSSQQDAEYLMQLGTIDLG